MSDLVTTAKALSDLNRIRAFWAVRDRELCVCQIVELLELAPSTVSKHLAVLQQAGLITTEKRGRWIYCRAVEPDKSGEMRALYDWIERTVGKQAEIKNDTRMMKKILCCSPEDLSRKQREEK